MNFLGIEDDEKLKWYGITIPILFVASIRPWRSYWLFVYDEKVLGRYRREKTIQVMGKVNAMKKGKRTVYCSEHDPGAYHSFWRSSDYHEVYLREVSYNRRVEVVYFSAVSQDGAAEKFTKHFMEDLSTPVALDDALFEVMIKRKQIPLVYLDEEGPKSAMPKCIAQPSHHYIYDFNWLCSWTFGVLLVLFAVVSLVGALIQDGAVGAICLLYIPAVLVGYFLTSSRVLGYREEMALKGGVSYGMFPVPEQEIQAMEEGSCNYVVEESNGTPEGPLSGNNTYNPEFQPTECLGDVDTRGNPNHDTELPTDDKIVQEAMKLARKVNMEDITYKKFATKLSKRLHLSDPETKKRFRKTKKAVIQPVMGEFGWHDAA